MELSYLFSCLLVIIFPLHAQHPLLPSLLHVLNLSNFVDSGLIESKLLLDTELLVQGWVVIEAQGVGMGFLSFLCRNMLTCVYPLKESCHDYEWFNPARSSLALRSKLCCLNKNLISHLKVSFDVLLRLSAASSSFGSTARLNLLVQLLKTFLQISHESENFICLHLRLLEGNRISALENNCKRIVCRKASENCDWSLSCQAYRLEIVQGTLHQRYEACPFIPGLS